jgi:hypothetical protein
MKWSEKHQTSTLFSTLFTASIGCSVHKIHKVKPAILATKNPQTPYFKGILRAIRKHGESGIRTRGTGLSPYTGLANRRLQPLGHLSNRAFTVSTIRGRVNTADEVCEH